MFVGTDLVFPSDRLNIFLETFTIWDSRSLGSVNPRMLAWSFPNGAFLGISEVIGLSLQYAQRLWFYFLFAFSGLSMYFLSTVVAKNKVKHYHVVGVISALFYMFNPFFALGVSQWPYLWLTYASLPLMLALFIKGLNERRGIKYVFIINVIWLLLSASQFVNPKYVIIAWIPLLVYFVFHLIVNHNKADFIHSCKFTFLLLGMWVLINFYWLLPNMVYIFQSISVTGDLYLTVGRNRIDDFVLNSAPLPETMRLVGSWILGSGFGGYPYVYWSPIYNSSLFVFIGYLIPVIAFIPLTLKKEKNIIFFSIFLLCALLLMTGSQPPFGQLNLFLITTIPIILEVFSLPNVLFGVYSVIAYAVLFGIGTVMIACYMGKKLPPRLPRRLRLGAKYLFTGTAIFLVIGLYAFPLWTGEVVYPGNDVLASNNYKIPDYYHDASSWLASDKDDFRIFPMPYSKIGYVAYAWEPVGYQGPDLTESLLGKSLIAEPINSDLGSSIAQSIVSNSTTNIAKVLAFMNVKYIVFHNDINWIFLNNSEYTMYSYIAADQKNMLNTLNSMDGFTYCRSFGQLDFYINNHWTPMRVYAASSAIYYKTFERLTEISELNYFAPREVVILSNNQLDVDPTLNRPTDSAITPNLTPNKTSHVSLTYEKLNPTLYTINIDASAPFLLVLSDSYDDGWVATVDGQQLSDKYHFNANGFANGWYINKTGTYVIVLEFQPQRLFYMGSAISLTTLIVCMVYLGRTKIKTRLKKIYRK